LERCFGDNNTAELHANEARKFLPQEEGGKFFFFLRKFMGEGMVERKWKGDGFRHVLNHKLNFDVTVTSDETEF